MGATQRASARITIKRWRNKSRGETRRDVVVAEPETTGLKIKNACAGQIVPSITALRL